MSALPGWSYPSWRPGFYPAEVKPPGVPAPLLGAAAERRAEHDGLQDSGGGSVPSLGGTGLAGVPLRSQVQLVPARRGGDVRGAGASPRRPAGPDSRPRRLRAGRGPARADARLVRPRAEDRLRLPARLVGGRRGRPAAERRVRATTWNLPLRVSLPAVARAALRRDGAHGVGRPNPPADRRRASRCTATSSTKTSRRRPGYAERLLELVS